MAQLIVLIPTEINNQKVPSLYLYSVFQYKLNDYIASEKHKASHQAIITFYESKFITIWDN